MEVGSSGDVTFLGIEECMKLQANESFPSVNSSIYPAIVSFNDSVICLEHAPTFKRENLIKAIVLGVLAILSFIGNSATIWSIRRSRRARRISRSSCSAIYTLILHLSIADLLVTIFCLAGEAGWNITVAWVAGNAACKAFKYFQMFSLFLSTYVLVLIGVDRFVAVRFPMKNLSQGSRGTTVLVSVYILSALLSIPQVLVFHVAKGPFVEEFYQCVTHGIYQQPWQEQLYAGLSIFFMFVLPLLILMLTYAATYVTIAKSEKVFKEEVSGRRPDLNRRRLIHRAKIKSLQISVVIVAAFIVWWTPYYAMMIIFIFLEPEKQLSEDMMGAIFFFGMTNSLVNPIIYGAFQLWPSGRRRRGSQSRDFSTSTRVTQASIVRNSVHSNRNRLDNNSVYNPESTALVTLKNNERATNGNLLHPNYQPKKTSNEGARNSWNGSARNSWNGISSNQDEHALLDVRNGDAITRV